MKKNILLLIFCSFLFAGCNNPYSQKVQKYYCPEKDDRHSFFYTDIYVPSNDCSHWNNYFVKIFNSSAYRNCIEANKVKKLRYEKGLCEKVVLETHKIRGSVCSVEVALEHKKIISKMCKGRNVDRAMSELDFLYEMRFKNGL